MGAPVKGRADYFEMGTWNASCSLCGRKRKAKDMVRNWMGMRRCPEHDEPRQPQDFVRNIKDDMTVDWAQPEQDIFVELSPTLIVSVVPDSVQATPASTSILTESGSPILTESGDDIEAEGGLWITPPVSILLPSWIGAGYDPSFPETPVFAWMIISGAGWMISNPTGPVTTFSTNNPAAPPAIAQAIVTIPLPNGGQMQGAVTVQISIAILPVGTNMTFPNLLLGLNL